MLFQRGDKLSISRRMNVAVAFLCLSSGFGIAQGLWAIFFPSQMIDSIATMLGETLQSPTIVHYYLCQIFGVYSTLGSAAFVVIYLFPYRKGEKWAWFTVLAGGTLMVSAGIILYLRNISDSTALVNAFYTLGWQTAAWILGLAIPAKEILRKQ
jgi:hypothetical protein